MLVSIALLLACIASADAAPGHRRAAPTRGGDPSVPASPSPQIRDAVVLLEQARVALCEAERKGGGYAAAKALSSSRASRSKQQPAPAAQGRSMADLVANARAGLHKREPVIHLDTIASIVQIALVLKKFTNQTVPQVDVILETYGHRIADATQLDEYRSVALATTHNVIRGATGTAMQVAARDRDANFNDSIALRFWRDADVTPQDVMSAAGELVDQVALDRDVVEAALARNAQLERMLSAYVAYCDKVVDLLVPAAVAAKGDDPFCAALFEHTTTKVVREMRTVAIKCQEGMRQMDGRLAHVLGRLEQAVGLARQVGDLMKQVGAPDPFADDESTTAAPSKPKANKKKKKKSKKAAGSPVQAVDETPDVTADAQHYDAPPEVVNDAVLEMSRADDAELDTSGPGWETYASRRRDRATTPAFPAHGFPSLGRSSPIANADRTRRPRRKAPSRAPSTVPRDDGAITLVGAGPHDAALPGRPGNVSSYAASAWMALSQQRRALRTSPEYDAAFPPLSGGALPPDSGLEDDSLPPCVPASSADPRPPVPSPDRFLEAPEGALKRRWSLGADFRPYPAGAPEDVAGRLNVDLAHFMQTAMRARQDDDGHYDLAYDVVRDAVAQLFPSAAIAMAGSVAYDLHMPSPISDLDLVVRHPNVSASDGLQILFHRIRCDRRLTSVKYISTASTPIIKATVADSSVAVDITWNVANVDESRVLVGAAMQSFPLFPLITMYMKYYLYMHGLGTPFYGGLGSFQLYLLVIFHLQANAACCTVSAGTCLRAFFQYYGSTFPVDSHCVSVFADGRPTPKVMGRDRAHQGLTMGGTAHRLCIESPFDPVIDVGRSAYNFAAIRQHLQATYSQLQDEPWTTSLVGLTPAEPVQPSVALPRVSP